MIEFISGFIACLVVEGLLVMRYLTKTEKPRELDPRFGRERFHSD